MGNKLKAIWEMERRIKGEGEKEKKVSFSKFCGLRYCPQASFFSFEKPLPPSSLLFSPMKGIS